MSIIKELTATDWNFHNSYADLPSSFYSKINPTPVKTPKLIILNYPLAKSLGLNVVELQSKKGAEIFAGNIIPEGAVPIAQAYAGHQFGYFTMLGDGRAILLGEQITPQYNRYDIQLKGSGLTPYSRGGDGRAAIGPMLREYIISEAMYNLGIPTTRSLAVVTTGEPVYRETVLSGAILTRIASSHIRVGTFQYVNNFCSFEELKTLADYTINRHYPINNHIDNPYLYLLRKVIKNQALLISKWQLVGFIHGVMNTDNMTISGETIDYGPCAFMDAYNIKTVFSSIDTNGRYAYGNQPKMAEWNLFRLAEALLPLLHEDQKQAEKIAEDALSDFKKIYNLNWMEGMRAKLGIFNEEVEDESLVNELLDMMQNYNADYTNTFRALTLDTFECNPLFNSAEFSEWYEKWNKRLSKQQESKEDSKQLMRNFNPSIIPRNHRVEEALKAAEEHKDFSVMEKLLHVLSNPYAYSSNQDEYTTLPPNSNMPYKTFCGT